MTLPDHLKYHFIASDSDCKQLELLFGKKYVGADCEWRAVQN